MASNEPSDVRQALLWALNEIKIRPDVSTFAAAFGIIKKCLERIEPATRDPHLETTLREAISAILDREASLSRAATLAERTIVSPLRNN